MFWCVRWCCLDEQDVVLEQEVEILDILVKSLSMFRVLFHFGLC